MSDENQTPQNPEPAAVTPPAPAAPIPPKPTAPARPLAKANLILNIVGVLLGLGSLVVILLQKVPCFLSMMSLSILMMALGIMMVTFQILSSRGLPLNWGRVVLRILVILGIVSFAAVVGFQTLDDIKKDRSVAYDIFPGALYFKSDACFETQLALGFNLEKEEAFGFTFGSEGLIGKISSESGAHNLMNVFRKANRVFSPREVLQAAQSENPIVFDSVITLVAKDTQDSISSGDLFTENGAVLQPHLYAWLHWRVNNIQEHTLEILKNYFASVNNTKLKPNLVFYREGKDWVLDLRGLGTVEDLPSDFAWIPANRVLLADGALKAANDELTSQWATKVTNWSGPNASQVALRTMLSNLYTNPPTASDVAEMNGEAVSAVRLTQPVSDTSTDSSRLVQLSLEGLESLQELDFTGTGVSKHAGLVIQGSESSLSVLRIRNEQINGIALVGLENLRDVDLSNLGMSYFDMDAESFKGKIRLGGNRLCSPEMQETLKKLSNVQGADQQNCKDRPMQWDTLLNRIYELSSEGDPDPDAKNLNLDSVEIPTGGVLWTEVSGIDWDYYGESNYRIFHPNAVEDGNNTLYYGQIPSLLGGKITGGMTRAQVEDALGTPYHSEDTHATWLTGDVCEEPYDGLEIGFDEQGVIQWVLYRGYYGDC